MIMVMSDAALSVAKHQGIRPTAKGRLSTTGRTSDTGIGAHILQSHLTFALQKSGACGV